MDFINYAPQEAAYDESFGEEMEVEYVPYEYGNIEKFVEFNSQIPEIRVVDMEVVDVGEITAKVEASLVD